MAQFNRDVVDRPDVEYISWSGATRVPYRNQFLFIDYVMLSRNDGGANDGLVPLSSSKWGKWKGVLPLDHMALGMNWHFTWRHSSLWQYDAYVRDLDRIDDEPLQPRQ